MAGQISAVADLLGLISAVADLLGLPHAAMAQQLPLSANVAEALERAARASSSGAESG